MSSRSTRRTTSALYNLGTALAAAGRTEEAAARYREALVVQPQHAAAKANLDRLEAARFEREGNAAAAGGDFAVAAESYRPAVALDGQTPARAGRARDVARQHGPDRRSDPGAA